MPKVGISGTSCCHVVGHGRSFLTRFVRTPMHNLLNAEFIRVIATGTVVDELLDTVLLHP